MQNSNYSDFKKNENWIYYSFFPEEYFSIGIVEILNQNGRNDDHKI